MTEKFTAKSVEEAKALAAKKFGKSISEIKFEILDEGKKGILGLGAKDAVVKATYVPPVSASKPVAAAPAEKKETAAVTTAPVANTLTYTGKPQALITGGKAEGGTMKYSTDGTNYSAAIPAGTDAGPYTVYYKVEGDKNHNNTDPQNFTVTIAQADPSKLLPDGYSTVAEPRDYLGSVKLPEGWTWVNGEIPDGMVINHKDFDRSNNRIENLEIMTYKENLEYTKNAGRNNPCKGEKSGKAIWTDKEAQAMKYLRKHGWDLNKIAKLFGCKYPNVVGRIVSGARYGHVPDAADVISIYPAIVMRTMNHNLSKKDQILNASIGLCGELGEVVDTLKKHYFQGHDLDVDHLKEEVGDVIYYLTLLMLLYDMDLSDTMFANWEKLDNRYPEGFSSERSINRKEGDV